MKNKISVLAIALLLSGSLTHAAGKKKKKKSLPSETAQNMMASAQAAFEDEWDELSTPISVKKDEEIQTIISDNDALQLLLNENRTGLTLMKAQLKNINELKRLMIMTQAKMNDERDNIAKTSISIWKNAAKIKALQKTIASEATIQPILENFPNQMPQLEQTNVLQSSDEKEYVMEQTVASSSLASSNAQSSSVWSSYLPSLGWWK